MDIATRLASEFALEHPGDAGHACGSADQKDLVDIVASELSVPVAGDNFDQVVLDLNNGDVEG